MKCSGVKYGRVEVWRCGSMDSPHVPAEKIVGDFILVARPWLVVADHAREDATKHTQDSIPRGWVLGLRFKVSGSRCST